MITGIDALELLGDDLGAAVRGCGELRAAAAVSPLASRHSPPRAFRLELTDGRTMKGHRVASAAWALRVERLHRLLPAEGFPRLHVRHGCALVFEWVDGVALSAGPVAAHDARGLGALARSLHAVATPDDEPDAAGIAPHPGWDRELSARLAWLRAGGWLSAVNAESALRLAAEHAPPRRGMGLVHGDLCPENVVVDAAGALQVVDNVGIDFHAPEFDLARTWYRWPASDSERGAFEAGYGAGSALDAWHRHFVHWAIVVLAAASEFRLRLQLASGRRPLARLHDVLARGAAVR